MSLILATHDRTEIRTDGFLRPSTPHGDGTFNVYDDLRDKLIAKGIPAEEIAYIHSANTEVQRKNCSARCVQVRSEFSSVRHRRWEPVPTCKKDL
jgi:hypothetical protein